jgi:hypothetical protein
MEESERVCTPSSSSIIANIARFPTSLLLSAKNPVVTTSASCLARSVERAFHLQG